MMGYNRKPERMIVLLVSVIAITSCKKYSDTPGVRTDPRFNQLYCNVPEAVNYNWNFPGTPDVSDAVCFYPSDVFKGNYLYTDSIYNASSVFLRDEVKNLSIVASNHTQLTVNGFCSSASLPFTADRNLHADADSTGVNGQLLCRNLDTLSGYMFASREDSTHIQFSFRVGSDTGVFFHRGTAVKQ